MGRPEQVELTVLCLTRRGNEVLLQNRIKADWRGYALPGGHVEPGESVVEAVKREMLEETGLEIESPRLCGVKQFPTEEGRYLVFLFLADRFSGQLRSCDEGENRWVERDRIRELNTVEDLEQLLRVMESEALTEFQYVRQDDRWLARLL